MSSKVSGPMESIRVKGQLLTDTNQQIKGMTKINNKSRECLRVARICGVCEEGALGVVMSVIVVVAGCGSRAAATRREQSP